MKVRDKIEALIIKSKTENESMLLAIKNRNIKKLEEIFWEKRELSLNEVDEEDIIFVCNLLKSDINLKKLTIVSLEDLTKNSFKAISEMTRFNRGLTELKLSCKDSTNEELKYFETNLSKNYYLTSLKLDKSTEAIEDLILRNVQLPATIAKKFSLSGINSVNDVVNFYKDNFFKFLCVCKKLEICDKNKDEIFIGNLPTVIIKYIFSFVKIEEALEILEKASKNKVTKSNAENEVMKKVVDYDSSGLDDNGQDTNHNVFVEALGDHNLMETLDGLDAYNSMNS